MEKILLIFLHGSGSSGRDLRTYIECVPLVEFNHNTFRQVADINSIDIIYPTATLRPYTAAMDMPLNVWFDRSSDFNIKGLDDKEDIEGVNFSSNKIIELINENESKYDHIIVGGFSMGGCLALTLLRANLSNKVKGIFSMGSFLVESSIVNEGTLSTSSSNLPIFMMHGQSDTMISVDWGRKTATNLLLKELDVEFKVYPELDHEISEEELVDAINWIKDITIINKKIDKNQKSEKVINKNVQVIPPSILVSMDVDTNNEVKKFASGTTEIDELTVKDLKSIPVAKVSAPVPYTVEHLDTGNNYRIIFHVPVETIPSITSRPVMACGGVFELIDSSGSKSSTELGSVETVISSSDPNNTAIEIGKRLINRQKSEGTSINPCPMQ
jgi:predicted esterase